MGESDGLRPLRLGQWSLTELQLVSWDTILRLRGMDGGRGRARVMKVTLGWADILYHDLTSCG